MDRYSNGYGNKPHYEICYVGGRKEAEAFQMDERSSILLLDKKLVDDNGDQKALLWLVETDERGFTRATPYTLTPYEEPEEKTIGELVAIISGLTNEVQKLKEEVNNARSAASATPASKSKSADKLPESAIYGK